MGPIGHLSSAPSPLPLLQVEGGQQLYTCALRPTGIYGEGHELMKSFYNEAVKRGGVVIGGVPPNSEHGRVYAGDKHSAATAALGGVSQSYLLLKGQRSLTAGKLTWLTETRLALLFLSAVFSDGNTKRGQGWGKGEVKGWGQG